jgi:hypothetical protein
MPVALCLGNFGQVLRGEAFRLRQNRRGNQNIVMPREMLDHPNWRVGRRREASAEFHQRFGLNTLDQMQKNIVEQTNLRVVEMFSAAKKKIRDTPQRGNAFVERAAVDRGFKFSNQ